tara:strand:- start:231 stop:752 length:522 start_codon:yes stop_codon:yes gene_type:complete
MTAKIKLNAASGGGSISINAPSSAGSDTDFLDTSGNLAVSGTTTCTGNLKAGTITDTSGNNSSTTAQIAQGRAKVWIKFNQDSGSISDSFNVSSVTDNGTGLFNVNFTTNMASANYVTVTGLTAYYGFETTDLRYPVHVDNQATNLVKTRCQQVANGGGYADSANVLLAVFGD